MNILFIHSETLTKTIHRTSKNRPLYAQDEIQFGISYISSVLKKQGHRTELFIVSKGTKDKELDRIIDDFKPQLICATTVFREYWRIAATAKYIKTKYPSIFILAGGPHITLNPEEAINESFDAICIGEGERPVSELVGQLQKGNRPQGIKNMWIKTGDGIERNCTRDYVQDIDTIPFPDRQMWQKWIKNKNTPHAVILGRGCPYDCSYCCNHALRKVSGGKYVRFRSPENIIGEIDQLLKEFPDTNTIYLEAEAINLDVKFLEDFCNKLEEYNKTLEKPVFYGANFRVIPSQDASNIFLLFRKANISYVNIGLESGSERIRKEVMKRNYSNDDVKKVVKLAKRFRLYIMLYVMIGIPTETMDDFRETIGLVRECKPNFLQLNVFCPYPGTDLYEYCFKNGLIKGEVKDRGRTVATMDLPGFSRKQIQKQYYRFFPNVYSKNKFHFIALFVLSYMVQKWRLSFLYRTAMRLIRL